MNLQASFVVNLVALDETSIGIFQCPSHSRDDRRTDLKGSRTLVFCSASSLVDFKLRTVPIRVLSMTIEENSELIDSRNDIFLNYLPFVLLRYLS